MNIFNCRMCKEEIVPNIVGGTSNERAEVIGKTMLKHLQNRHPTFMSRVAEVSTVFSGFLITNAFDTNDEQAMQHVEKTRAQLIEMVNQYAPASLAIVKQEDSAIVAPTDDEEEALRFIDCPECGEEVCIEQLIADFEDGEDIEDEDEDDEDEKDTIEVKVIEKTTETTEKTQRRRKSK